MRRGRAPCREPSGSGGPQWDDPNGQLPGTGILGNSGDSLYRSSSLRRRTDASPVRGTVESVGQDFFLIAGCIGSLGYWQSLAKRE